MFEGFDTRALETERGMIHARVGGSGPPLLLLHGYPETHLMWHGCAPALSIGLGVERGRYPEPVLAAYRAQLEDAGAVEAICEDYRAGASIDRQLDEADRGRPIGCPVLVLWGTRGALEWFYGDVLAVWGPWAREVRGRGVDASHFLVEDRPDEVADELATFFSAG